MHGFTIYIYLQCANLGKLQMKRSIVAPALASLVFCSVFGCEQKGASTAEKPANDVKANDPRKPAPLRFDSVAVLPIVGDMGESWSKEKDASKAYLERKLPEAIASAIAKKRTDDSLKVIAPAVVNEKRRPEMNLKSLGLNLDAKTLLIGKAVPNGSFKIDFQLVVAETGELLWGDSLISGNEGAAEGIADMVVQHLMKAGTR